MYNLTTWAVPGVVLPCSDYVTSGIRRHCVCHSELYGVTSTVGKETGIGREREGETKRDELSEGEREAGAGTREKETRRMRKRRDGGRGGEGWRP